MKAMTVKDFDSLEHRDFENPAVRDSIRTALKEREAAKPTVTMTEIENAVGDTSDEYTEGVIELFESKGFEVSQE